MTTHTQQDLQAILERKAVVQPRQKRMRNRSMWVRLTFLVPAILYLILFFGYPLYYSFSVSFERYDLQAEITGIAPFIGLTNYINVIQGSVFSAAALHTLLFTLGSIIPQFLLGMGLALFFNKRFPLSRFLRSILLLPWLLPLVVAATVWRWLFDQTNGIIDQFLSALHILPPHFGWLTTQGWALGAVIITNIWIGIPLNMVLIYSGLQGIDKEFYEAASIDGASRWQSFLYVTLPLLRTVIGVVLMLGLIYTLKVFDVIYVITSGGPANATQTFATWSYNLSFTQQLFGQGAAMGNMIMLISLIVALFYLWWTQQQNRKSEG